MPGLAAERRVVVEEQGEPDDRAAVLGEQHLRSTAGAEQVVAQLGLVERDGVGEPLVLGQVADEPGDGRHVGRGCGADHDFLGEPPV